MIDYLLFDIDNTLYPSSCGLGAEMHRLMTVFVADYLGVDHETAETMRRAARKRHGTTLAWLREERGMIDVDPYLEAVHPTDLSPWITDEHALVARKALDAIDMPASILTNGPREHAMRVLDRLGIAERFERVFDLRANEFVGKPAPTAYLRALGELGIEAGSTLFVDDVVQYLLPFRELGGNIVHLSAVEPTAPEIPTIAALQDLVPIIYPQRSRG